MRILATPSTRVFLNCVNPQGRPVYLKRLANRFQTRELRFEYEKGTPGEELLSLRLFQSGESPVRTKLKVRILASTRDKLEPSRSWTLTDRLYDLRPVTDTPVMVLGTDDQWVDEGRVCFLPLGSDMEPGKYTIQIARQQGEDGYLVLSKTIPGAADRRAIFSEQQTDAED